MAQKRVSGELFILTLSEDGFSTEVSLACANANDFTRTRETADGRCKEDGGAQNPIPTTYGFTLSNEGLILVDDSDNTLNVFQLDNWFKSGVTLDFKYGMQKTGEYQYTGKAFISSLTGPAGGIDDVATFSLELTGQGDYSEVVNA